MHISSKLVELVWTFTSNILIDVSAFADCNTSGGNLIYHNHFHWDLDEKGRDSLCSSRESSDSQMVKNLDAIHIYINKLVSKDQSQLSVQQQYVTLTPLERQYKTLMVTIAIGFVTLIRTVSDAVTSPLLGYTSLVVKSMGCIGDQVFARCATENCVTGTDWTIE